ncbi:MAG: hypothetical protein IKO36_05665 [Bacteroidaceae bacterium]|nr:hypothetical protein [Bacteroidaceae bacterium]
MKLPSVPQNHVLELMDAENISRLHLGKDPLPYLWYKKLLQLSKIGATKYITKEYGGYIMAYCMATRKQRREVAYFRKVYLTVIKILQLKVSTEKTDKTNK